MKILKKIFNFIVSIPKYFAISLVWLYKKTLSRILPNTCVFTPSCSVYAICAFKRFGFFGGFALSVKRVMRCNHKTTRQTDPVPHNIKGDYKWLI